jgi:cell division protein FtsW
LGGITAVGVLVICIILLIGPDKLGNDNRLGTWVKRVERFFETKEADVNNAIVITDENRQVVNSKIAIANGISPCGPGNSVQRDYLALAYSDFVYAVIIEEYGILGGIIIILLYVIILARAGKIARRCAPNEATESILVIGISLIIVMQAFINMSVATELGPTTGQNLPLISRGGMSMLVTSLAFGLILGISARNEERIQKEIAKQEAEQAEASTPIEESTEEANNQ